MVTTRSRVYVAGMELKEKDPQVLKICHRCRLVHTEAGGWMTKQTYRETTGIDPATCRLTHTYCPFCYDVIKSDSRAA